ncbi:hypothetical protein HCN44_004311 [Aphidius gifuensis]|uniref:histone acetyltransferase n=1 Tax=Aphidius gifuensis TaxID=684658 RepID=A0A834Y0N3_APHGI|nr:protein cbp-1-like [Aphidius gifuensis]KAF7994839.1 hypothetical protein HCN44_004311 [Aphidius gifuensis]
MSVSQVHYQQNGHQVQFESATCDDYSKRCQRIQQRLVLLIHAKKCQIRERESGTISCTWLHCLIMKEVLNHLLNCQAQSECLEAHCYSSKMIIKHWNYCQDITCDICSPLKQAEQEHADKIMQQAKDFQELFDSVLGSDSIDDQSSSSNGQTNDLLDQQIIEYTNSFESEKVEAIPVDVTQLTNKWQSCITDKIRNDNVSRMIKKLISPFDLNSLCDGKFDEISNHVKTVEKGFYGMAKSRDEYDSLVGIDHDLK